MCHQTIDSFLCHHEVEQDVGFCHRAQDSEIVCNPIERSVSYSLERCDACQANENRARWIKHYEDKLIKLNDDKEKFLAGHSSKTEDISPEARQHQYEIDYNESRVLFYRNLPPGTELPECPYHQDIDLEIVYIDIDADAVDSDAVDPDERRGRAPLPLPSSRSSSRRSNQSSSRRSSRSSSRSSNRFRPY